MKIDASLLPLALGGSFRNAFHCGNFGETESAKEAEIDNFGERSITFGEFVESIADARQFTVIRQILNIRPEGCDLEEAAAFLSTAAACVIDDQAAHDARCVAHESGFVGKAHALFVSHFNVGLMEESGCADGYGQPGAGQLTPGQTVQFGIERCKERVGRCFAPVLSRLYQRSYVGFSLQVDPAVREARLKARERLRLDFSSDSSKEAGN